MAIAGRPGLSSRKRRLEPGRDCQLEPLVTGGILRSESCDGRRLGLICPSLGGRLIVSGRLIGWVKLAESLVEADERWEVEVMAAGLLRELAVHWTDIPRGSDDYRIKAETQ